MLQRTVGMEQRLPRGRLSAFEFRYLTEFQSHEPEFDYLKSFEIEEKINKVRWVNQPSSSRLILSTNDKTIKLWKASEASFPSRNTLHPAICLSVPQENI